MNSNKHENSPDLNNSETKTEHYQKDGITLIISITANKHNGWTLQILDVDNNATTWEDSFSSIEEARKEAHEAIEQEGPEAFVGSIHF